MHKNKLLTKRGIGICFHRQTDRQTDSMLNADENVKRRHYLRKIAAGELFGPMTGYPEIDMPWLKYVSEEEIDSKCPDETIYEFLRNALSRETENYTAINYYGTTISYKNLFLQADRIAHILKIKYNVKDGEIISVLLPTIPEAYYLLLALNKIGAVANMIDPRINAERIKDLIGNSGLIFTVDVFNEKVKSVTDYAGRQTVISIPIATSMSLFYRILLKSKTAKYQVDGFVKWKDFLAKCDEIRSYDEDITPVKAQIAALIATSGTTGIPKRVALTNKNIVYIEFYMKNCLPMMKPRDRYIVIMPPFIVYGLICGIVGPMLVQQEMILIPKFEPDKFDRLISKYRPNHILGVPSFFEKMMESGRLKNKDLSFIKYCIAGGDKLNTETEKEINEFLKKHKAQNMIYKGYGMSELCSVACVNYYNAPNEIGSVGIPLGENLIKIVKENKSQPYGEEGEVFVSSPSIMDHYIDNVQETNNVKITDENGRIWLKTGDIGKIDVNGMLTIVGRIKRVIVRPDGHNVFPMKIEEVINTVEGVKDSAVIGVESPDSKNGRIPAAFIVIKNNADKGIVLKKIKEMSEIKIPPRDRALEYHFIDQLPMTGNGKVDYKALEMQKMSMQ